MDNIEVSQMTDLDAAAALVGAVYYDTRHRLWGEDNIEWQPTILRMSLECRRRGIAVAALIKEGEHLAVLFNNERGYLK